MNGKTTAPTLQFDLSAITIDFSLAQQLPYALSRYYLALPLGRENGAVSVAMAYPENAKARQTLSRLLEARVVPVFTPAERLLPVLERIYCPENQESHAILAWYEQPEWETIRLPLLLSTKIRDDSCFYAERDAPCFCHYLLL